MPDLVLSINDAWDVFILFMIPIGGGIPAGVLLAQSRKIPWPTMFGLYFVSDVVLAFLFEPITWLIKRAAKHSPFLTRFLAHMKFSIQKTVERFGVNPGPLTLILISFGVDPMTGRSAALYAGHGFITGWAVAIVGDLIFFGAIMASTLWLNSVLGDGTWTAILIMLAMFTIPPLVRRFSK